jgi:hypothetical protein
MTDIAKNPEELRIDACEVLIRLGACTCLTGLQGMKTTLRHNLLRRCSFLAGAALCLWSIDFKVSAQAPGFFAAAAPVNFTVTQANRGKSVYNDNCASCHSRQAQCSVCTRIRHNAPRQLESADRGDGMVGGCIDHINGV